MTTPIKAVRATITLGDIEIEGYQLPDGEYKVSTQTFKDTLNSLIGNSTGKKYLKPILEASKSIVDILPTPSGWGVCQPDDSLL